jgi:hypothetical protein
MPGRIEIILDIYKHGNRREYFEKVTNKLANRTGPNRFVVLLDPDNGIAGTSQKSLHVCKAEISCVWSAMRHGDALLIYQHQFRDQEWASKRRQALASALHLAQDKIRLIRWKLVRDVCFFELTKEEGLSRT